MISQGPLILDSESMPVPATPFMAPAYFAPSYFAPLFSAGGPVAPPTIGTISLTSVGGDDTVDYPAPAAGANAVAGDEAATPALTRTGTGSGSFSYASATPGDTNYDIVRAFDVVGILSAASNGI